MCDQGADDRKVDAQLRLSETFALVKKKKRGTRVETDQSETKLKVAADR